MTMTYKEPETPERPFKLGDIVEVLDRDHNVLSIAGVVAAGPRRVKTTCGRSWTQAGWWAGDQVYPFPSIRLLPESDIKISSGVRVLVKPDARGPAGCRLKDACRVGEVLKADGATALVRLDATGQKGAVERWLDVDVLFVLNRVVCEEKVRE